MLSCSANKSAPSSDSTGQSHIKITGGSIKIFRKEGWTPDGAGGFTTALSGQTLIEISYDAGECLPASGSPPNPVLIDANQPWSITVHARLATDFGGGSQSSGKGVKLCSNQDCGLGQNASDTVFVSRVGQNNALENEFVPNDVNPDATHRIMRNFRYRDLDPATICDRNDSTKAYCDFEKSIDVNVGNTFSGTFGSPRGLCRFDLVYKRP